MTTIIYADFIDALSYLASRRIDTLRAAGVQVDWRAVEERPDVPVTGLRGEVEHTRIQDEWDAAAALLGAGEELPGSPPAFRAHSEAAVSVYAEAVGAGIADEVRRLLFDLYWVDGADIGNPNVLRTPLTGVFKRGHSGIDALDYAGFAVSVARGPISTAAWRRVQDWRHERADYPGGALPVLLAADGTVLRGVDAVRRLGKELSYHDAHGYPALADARHYPLPAVRPAPTWSSWHGGRYLNRFRPHAAA